MLAAAASLIFPHRAVNIAGVVLMAAGFLCSYKTRDRKQADMPAQPYQAYETVAEDPGMISARDDGS
ncbi:MAG: hypothetical protein JSW26_18285 [Desulfobacterales bacterium]|nr:MAG: hypothetical protein JSW26_18285 [Desulfobacterales bacterium]